MLTAEAQASWRDQPQPSHGEITLGDTTVITMMCVDYRLRPIGNLTATHECVDWDRLMEWVKLNSRDLTRDE
ncbi:hypothetical protein N7490_010859 [Penicillium lividum]|nr:hypothetical protein N7490_010859 [Penicillium lividum]